MGDDVPIRLVDVDGITIELLRKPVKNINFHIYPPDGRVRVTAPMRVGMNTIRQVISDKLHWIRAHQSRLRNHHAPSPPGYTTGETVFYRGVPYQLIITHHSTRPAVILHHDTIELRTPPDFDQAQREQLLSTWYRHSMNQQVPDVIANWEHIIGVQTTAWGIRRMKTRWGTCNTKTRRIWLNLELARRPDHLLEYIIVHELMHLRERLHNDRFYGLMDHYLPLWRNHREELKHKL